jgi:hypothetical protein
MLLSLGYRLLRLETTAAQEPGSTDRSTRAMADLFIRLQYKEIPPVDLNLIVFIIDINFCLLQAFADTAQLARGRSKCESISCKSIFC